MKLLVMGDSHVATLRLGWERQAAREGLNGADIRFAPFGPADRCIEPFFEIDAGRVRITHPRLRGRGTLIPPNEHVDRYVVSALFNTFSVVRDRETWSRFDPPGVTSGRSPLSAAAMEQIIVDHQRYIRDLVTTLDGFGLPLIVVESPYPFRHIRVVQEIGPHRVIAADALVRRSARAFLADLRIPVVDVPAHLRDSDGFTRREFANPRWVHHGNADFGAEMLGEVVRAAVGLHEQLPVGEADGERGGGGEEDHSPQKDDA